MAEEGHAPKLIGWGRDPAWHPKLPLLVFAGSRRVGKEVIDSDLMLTDGRGSTRSLTTTALSPERWPTWIEDGGAILYTIDHTTDLGRVEFLQ